MRELAVIAIGFSLVIAGQLCAQATDPFEAFQPQSDPFGGSGDAPRQVEPNARQPVSKRNTGSADQAKKRARSQTDALFSPVRVGRTAASHERIEEALNRETAFDYLDQPLKDVLEDISFTNNIPIVIDTMALEDYGIDTGTPVTRSLKGISLRSALRLILRNLELTFVIRDEILQVTTPEAAASAPLTRFYHVAELLPSNGDGKVLVELIKTLVAPNTWCGADKVGAIIYVEHLESLAIRQTDDAFHEIEELLATTKQLTETQRQSPGKRVPELDPFE